MLLAVSQSRTQAELSQFRQACQVIGRSFWCASNRKSVVSVCLFVVRWPSAMESINLRSVRTFRIRRHSISRSERRRSETKRRLTVEWRSLHVAAAASLNFFYYRRTDSFMLALAVAFTETPKETVFTDPQRRVNGVPPFFIPVSPRACWTFKLAFPCPPPLDMKAPHG